MFSNILVMQFMKDCLSQLQCLEVIARLQTCKCGLDGMKALLVRFALLWNTSCCGGECTFCTGNWSAE